MAEVPARCAASLRRPANAAGFGWRWLGAAFCFALFGAGSIVLGTVVVPLVALASRDPGRRVRRVRSVVGGALRFFIFVMRRSGGLSYEVTGLHHAVEGRSYLIVANHPTLIDAIFLLAFFPMADCVVKEGMVRNPFTRALVRAADYISNSDPVALLETAGARLKAGRSVILFPEGTRSPRGGPLCFKPGAAALALRSRSECLPVVIRCEPLTLGKGEPWYRIPRRRPHFSMSVQPPISAAIDESAGSRRAHRSFNERLEAYFTARMAGSC